MPEGRLVLGAMSGTSADGVDVAVVGIAGSGYEMSSQVLKHHHYAYSEALRQMIFRARGGAAMTLREMARLGREISLAYAAAANEAMALANIDASQVACIAAHGQTLFHDPPLTIQWFDPALLAEKTRCAVVSDFRRADCAAGGQGAPLVPFADFILFRHPEKNRVLVNIGGIANITFIPAGGTPDDLRAFDTGPGNCISDFLMRRFDPSGPGYDRDGQRARCGRALRELVDRVLAHTYFQKKPPKSTDGPEMIAILEAAQREHANDLSLQDLLASACQITAKALADAIHQFLPAPADELIVSGGGIHNAAIMAELRTVLNDVPIRTSDDHGVSSQAKEALAFALLGLATIDNVPANVPSATGASRPVVLGCITPRP